MAFISAKASAVVSKGSSNSGGYLSASKLGDGDSMRIAIVSPEPLEFWTVWGESESGQKKPFRFLAEPSLSDIEAELGEFKQRMNYEGTELEKPKFAISLFVFDYQDEKIKVLEIGQKTIIKELDKISQTEDYRKHSRVGFPHLSHRHEDGHGIPTYAGTTQEGIRHQDPKILGRRHRSWL